MGHMVRWSSVRSGREAQVKEFRTKTRRHEDVALAAKRPSSSAARHVATSMWKGARRPVRLLCVFASSCDSNFLNLSPRRKVLGAENLAERKSVVSGKSVSVRV